jgi:hypothetical protein
MASDDVNLKPAGRNGSADPKPGGGRNGSADPKPGGGRNGSADPKPGGGRGAIDGTSSFGGGTGLVVVSFISPVCMDIPELAARILRGGGGPQPPGGGSRRVKALGNIAVLAQKEARQEIQKQQKQAKSLEQAKGRLDYLERQVKKRPT